MLSEPGPGNFGGSGVLPSDLGYRRASMLCALKRFNVAERVGGRYNWKRPMIVNYSDTPRNHCGSRRYEATGASGRPNQVSRASAETLAADRGLS
jgi:hypothetical protein